MTENRHVENQDAAIQIGKALERLANLDPNLSAADRGAEILKAKVEIIAKMRRNGNAMPPGYDIRFVDEDHETEKVLVIPDPDMLSDAKQKMLSNGYDLYTIYRNAIAAEFVGEAVDDVDLLRLVRTAAASPPERDEFFYFRIGEYAINECQ
ncbi:MAG: hypothetical protein AAGK02_10410 [Pseudomonadota bacterium]